jgi:hypothetical protein
MPDTIRETDDPAPPGETAERAELMPSLKGIRVDFSKVFPQFEAGAA